MDERGHGVILRVRPMTETSLVCHWLTEEHGRIALVAKGARRAKSVFAGKLDVFLEGEVSFVRSRRSELHVLREVVIGDYHAKLREELGWLEQAAYAVDLVERFTESETPVPEVWHLFQELLGELTRERPQARTVYWFEMQLLAGEGLTPDFGGGGSSEGARALAADLESMRLAEVRELEPSGRAVRELDRGIMRVLTQHLGRVPVKRAAALAAGRARGKSGERKLGETGGGAASGVSALLKGNDSFEREGKEPTNRTNAHE